MPFYCNLLFCLAGLLWSLYRTLTRGYLVSLQVIVWGATLVFLFVEPLINGGSRLDELGFNLIVTFGLSGLLLGSIVTNVNGVDEPGNSTRVLPNWIIAIGTIVYLLILSWHAGTAIANGALTDVVSTSRVQTYLTDNYARGSSIAEIAGEHLQFLFWICLGSLWRRKKRRTFLILSALPLIDHLATANTRFGFTAAVLATGTFVLGFRTQREQKAARRSRMKLGFAVLTLSVGFAVFYGIVGNALRSGTLQNGVEALVSDASTMGAAVVLHDLPYYDFLRDLHNAIDTSKLDFDNGAAFYYGLVAFVPRTLWDNKPYTATSVRLTEALVGKVGAGLPINTYTIYGEGYWQAGYAGSFFEAFLFLAMYAVLFSWLGRIRDTRLARLMVGFSLIPNIRAEVPITFYVTQLLFVALLLVLAKPDQRTAPEPF